MTTKVGLHITLFLFSVWFCVFVYVPGSTQETNCNFKVIVEQYLHNNGFHRNLSYIINFANEYEDTLPWANSDECHIGLEQVLPAGIYASPDEVGQLAIIKSPVNIEDSTEEAKDITVHVISQVKDWKVMVSLPVHARYHSAVAGGGKKRNTIQPPQIYLNCIDDKLSCDVKEEVSGIINNFCPKVSSGKCPWMEVPITLVTNTITWDVPVGNTDHYYIVAAGTVFSIIVGSLYLLKTIHEYTLNSRRIKAKTK